MTISLTLVDWQARAPGLANAEQWHNWARLPWFIDAQAPLVKPTELSAMEARRLTSGSKQAVECGLAMLRRHQIDAALYTSRHGELERNFHILQALAAHQDVSPTDFALSVHNAAVGSLTISAKQPLTTSSLSAGIDTFQQGLYEVMTLLQAGYQKVLMVDFDGAIPAFYHPDLPHDVTTWPYASAWVFTSGSQLSCATQDRSIDAICAPKMPQSLQFLWHYLRTDTHFEVAGEQLNWCWRRR